MWQRVASLASCLGRRSGALGRPLAKAAGRAGLLLPVAMLGLLALGWRMGPAPIEAADAGSVVVLDRADRLLRPFTTPDGRWRLPVEIEAVDAHYLDMLLAYEDKSFWDHRGVDPIAFLRSGLQLVRDGAVRSGGSTLTMQVARLLDGRHERSGLGKLRQIVRALQLEDRLDKRAILTLYLRLAPFGGNLEGVRAASLAYFGKEPRRLSIGEAALLVALPQAPELRRPDLRPDAARRGRDRVIARALAAGIIDAAEAARALGEPVPTRRQPFPQIAPHLAEEEVAAFPGRAVHRLTIDRDLQAALEELAAKAAPGLDPRASVALVAIDNATGEVLAHVGSAGYLDARRFGAIDMVGAVRSPGSTLKPMIYGLAFEAGLAHPETLIDDQPTRFGRYAPENFDDQYRGTIPIREALQLSLNVPAVKVLAAVGPGRLTARLRDAGIRLELPPETAPSLAIGLGGVGMTLHDLAGLYAGLARGGEAIPLRHRRGEAAAGVHGPAGRLLEPVPAWYVASILQGTPAPRNAKGGQIAYKTGTSYGYRDAWAAGYDGRTTIAVWVGRPDGTPIAGLTGVGSAAPILFDAFARLGQRRAPLAPAPPGSVVSANAGLPPPLRVFQSDRRDGGAGAVYAEPPLAIAFPPDRADLEIARALDGTPRPVVLKAEGGVLPLTWLVDGAPLAPPSYRREALFVPSGAGFAKVSVIDATGKVDRVVIGLH